MSAAMTTAAAPPDGTTLPPSPPPHNNNSTGDDNEDDAAGRECECMLERAEECYARGDRATARELLDRIVATPLEADATTGIRCKEQAIYRLGELFLMANNGDALMQLLTSIRPFFALLPKAKTTKMVRRLFEWIVQCGVSLPTQHTLCLDTIRWARAEKRTFLRHRLQLRLVEVLFEMRELRTALHTLIALLREVRRLDDRTLLLDIHLLESKMYYAMRNTSKARAALVAARTTANSIYCPPLAQAEIDLQSGVLHAEERDPKTAYSYFYEAFEGFHALGDQAKLARRALRYMILTKIATDSPDELAAVLSSKSVLEYRGPDVDALRGIAAAYAKQDTHQFNEVLERQRELGEHGILHDEVVRRQLQEMYDTLMERHLLKLVLPYHRVQLAYLAGLLRLDEATVEARVSQLILDGKLHGIVDQQHRCLVLFDEVEQRRTRKSQHPGGGNNNNNNGNAATDSGGGGAQKSAHGGGDKDDVVDDTERLNAATTLHQDALVALESYDALVTALFDKVAGKYDALVDEVLAKRRAALRSNAAEEQQPPPQQQPGSNATASSRGGGAGGDKSTSSGGGNKDGKGTSGGGGGSNTGSR